MKPANLLFIISDQHQGAAMGCAGRPLVQTPNLDQLAAGGAAILLYTSELAEIQLVCDRVLIMHDGRIVDEQDAAHATESSLLTAAHGLEVLA